MESTFNWSHGYDIASEYSKPVAYFSMEFAIDQALKIYSGGLGYLAGSHMKSAYATRQNMIGIGMLWKQGYYDQLRDINGYMRVHYQNRSYSFLQDTGVKVPVQIKGSQVWVKAMYLAPSVFQTVPMFFLTTDLPENDFLSRTITERLYHPNDAARIAQNIVLGIGGSKIIDKLNWPAEIFHMNEAHSLPIACHLYQKYKSVEDVRKHLVFTTHTPEMAGNAVRSLQLLDEMGFFNGLELKTAREITKMHSNNFEYTPAALRLAKRANGVSKLHGVVARKMWKDYEDICEITSITNSQNQNYWQDKKLKFFLDENNDQGLVYRKKELKTELFKIVADQTGKIFDPNTLTIVWARRFAAYKRADLITKDFGRFISLVDSQKQPVQIIWAGKPYPEDHNSIAIFNNLVNVSRTHAHIAVLTGYELELSAALKKGADIWLNTPRRPQEASGTSGMTAAMNGAINFSINDGWIPEFAQDGHNSFIIPEADVQAAIPQQDAHDHQHMMRLLEEKIVPLYYQQPNQWMHIMKNSMREVTPQFDSDRMAREYYEKMFV
jgi:starch phosphorylase